DLCAALRAAGLRPLGLHGAIAAARRPPRITSGAGPDPVDFGLVGDVTGFDLALIELAIRGGYLPVIACLGAGDDGQVYNINPDIVANHLATAPAPARWVRVPWAPGVRRDGNARSPRTPTPPAVEARRAIADGTVAGGMIPKLEESFAALAK